jgi:pilus assembly protein CpaF
MEDEVITTQDIFVFEQQGIDQDGRVRGFHRATGVRPRFSERLERAGIRLPQELFDPTRKQYTR